MSPLRLDTEDGAFTPLATGGFAIVRGEPDQSELIRRVESADEARRMPPSAMGHEPLTASETATLRKWIEEGAQWSQHWAFDPPRRPAGLATRPDAWVRNPVDRFILSHLDAAGLEPTGEAGRTKLLRRVTLDLTGLPPTSGELRAYLEDQSPLAYEKAVDRLLSSPRFGERMAFRWLDAARYADTNGYQNDQSRDMWRWRDWVISAFNSNMPFDQFTIEQLAGDLLPNPTLAQLIATGFNRNHRGNAENGTDPDEYQVEYAVDRLETTATVWLGLTMGCARCHDHKYDPISQREFYRFYAYFNNVSDRGRYYKYGNTPPIVHAPTVEQQTILHDLDQRIEQLASRLEARVDEIEAALEDASLPPSMDAWAYSDRLATRRTFDAAGRGIGIQGGAAQLEGHSYFNLGDTADLDFYDPFTLSAWVRAESPTGGVLARYEASGPKGFGLFLVNGKLQLRLDTSSISDRTRIESVNVIRMGEWTHVAGVYDGSRNTSGMRLFVNGTEVESVTLIDDSLNSTRTGEPLRIGYGPGPQDRFRGLIDDARVYLRALSSQQVAILAVAASPLEIAQVPREQRTHAAQSKLRWAFLNSVAPGTTASDWRKLQGLRLEREDFVATLPTVMVMDERPDVRPTHVLFRGAFDAPRERVDPGLPAALPPMPGNLPNNRLGLARWLTDSSHPLTARVTVNRFWQMIFGRGIVSTVEDFGSQGSAPTHPKLLDWLASEFIATGWDVKNLLRTIVTSATYRQTSKVSPAALEKDPENVLLARAPRERLPAESIRDQALSIAGVLSSHTGGPSVKPYQPAGLWKDLSNWGAYKNDHGDSLYRRSLYTFWKRTLGPPAMLAFDAAPRETCVVREVRTNTPVQALNLMNDPTFMEAARLYAERMLREGGNTDRARLDYGFVLATARQPGSEESEILGSSLNHFRDRFVTWPGDAAKYLSSGEHPRDPTLEPSELAAYTAVASMLLNLDETITRE